MGRAIIRFRYCLIASFAAGAISFISLISCNQVTLEKLYRHGAVVCSDKIAAEIGVKTLQSGGNAMDAACATALALAVTYPEAGNIGGGGFALVYDAKSRKISFLDFRETTPAGARTELFLDSTGRVDRDRATVGPLSAGTPGTVAGLWEMHQRYGRRSWDSLVVPARQLAESGFEIGSYFADALALYADDLRRFPATEAIFFSGGAPLSAGSRLIQTDLARTLALIEEDGRNGFYLGETARKISQFCAQSGGLITESDLAEYQPIWREPIQFRFRDLDIYAPGLPSSGGVVLAEIMKMVELYAIEQFGPQSPEYMHLFIEAARRAYADREAYLGDPAFSRNFTNDLISDSYITSRGNTIDQSRASLSSEILPGLTEERRESDQTTHLITADQDGNIVSLTYTINLEFGSKAVVPEAGFFLNNEMDDFAISPGQPNAFGLAGGEPNRMAPGKRMLSSMTPTIVLRSGQPYLAVGSPGGSKIITAVAQTIINYRLFAMTITQAVEAARFHHQWLPDTVFVERGGFEKETLDKLFAMGHTIAERSHYCEVMALAFSSEGLYKSGAADPRREGVIVGW